MARFHVGQRVLIKYSLSWPELAGKVGTIISRSVSGGLRGDSEWIVAPDCWGSEVDPTFGLNCGDIFAPNSDQLEPATDSYDKIEWSECCWQPEHLRVGA